MKGTSGISDYVISGTIGNDPIRDDCIKGYVWELKAPQCYLFRKDGENRLCPTTDLFEAENQLLNYYDDLKLQPKMVDRFHVGHPDNLCIGGIIIGSRTRLVKGKIEEKKRDELLKDAMRIRKTQFYDHAGIAIVTWSQVLNSINKKFIDITKNSVDQNHRFTINKMEAGTKSAEERIQTQ